MRAGFIGLVGRPNVGKSTLLNHLLGQKLAIATSKPQTTRNRILGIKNLPDAQLVLVDTPGLHRPRGKGRSRLNSFMMGEALAALAEVDVLVVLKCTSTYPATPENSNLATIPHLRDLFKAQVGLSDHTMGIGVPIASVALGATLIEKHFTLSRAEGGVDSAFSIEPAELRALVIETERAWKAMGQITYGCTAAESIKDRRSVYISKDLKSGDPLTEANLKLIRPGRGLAPKFYDLVLGKRINRDVKRGTPLSWDLIG